MKVCNECDGKFPADDFPTYRDRTGAVRFRNVCRACKTDQEQMARYRKGIRDRGALLQAWR